MFSQTFSSVWSVITLRRRMKNEEDVDEASHSVELPTETNAKPKLTFFYTRSASVWNSLSTHPLSHDDFTHASKAKTLNDQLLLIEAVVSGGEGPELESLCGTTGSPSGRVSPVSRGRPRVWAEEWMLHRCVVVKTELTLKLFSCRSTPQVYSHLWSWPLWSESCKQQKWASCVPCPSLP